MKPHNRSLAGALAMLLLMVFAVIFYPHETQGRADAPACVAVDGDTFRCGRERVRIADIDAPEIDGRCREERVLALQARARLAQLLRSGAVEMRRSGRDRDSYGRLLRIVTVDGRNAGDILVAEGLARAWSGRREPWC